MANAKQSHFTGTSGDKTDRSMNDLKGEAALERMDHQADDEYLPMDIYVDPRTVKEHFQIHLP